MSARNEARTECDRTLGAYVEAVKCYGYQHADDEYRRHRDAIDAYAAAAAAEAREPLVGALRAVDALLGEYAESNAFGKERCISRIATIIGTAVFALKGETP